MIIHVVKSGESVYSIARNYGVPPARIIQDNELLDPNQLVVGQTLVILYHEQAYVVQEGDTLASVANAYGVTENQLLRNNPSLEGLDIIYPGQILVIEYAQQKQGSMSINGYAYPFIDRSILRRTLPYLTYITMFTYGFTPEGELIDLDDVEVINIAREYGVAPIMLISTLTDEGTFSNELAHSLLSNSAAQDRLIDAIIANMRAKNYYGLDIDFEYVFAYDAAPYAEFIAKTRERLNEAGLIVITALAPKTSADQRGLLYEGHNYAEIGRASDAVLLMTYEWGYTYAPWAAWSLRCEQIHCFFGMRG